jgi:DNA-directed RNA polymerase subunit RPC12/RpoP
VVAISVVAGVFFVVMAFRGLMAGLAHYVARCADCGRLTQLPLPTQRRQCWRCHYRWVSTIRPASGRMQPRH